MKNCNFLTKEAFNNQSNLHFLRYEFKYIISNELKELIEKELSCFMSFDPFVKKQRNNQYHVRSLYFNDPFKLYNKINNNKIIHKRKFRIRTYSILPDDNVPIFLEIKGKYDNFVYKHRTHYKNNIFLFNKNDFDLFKPSLSNFFNENNINKTFYFNLLKKRISPILLIDYERRSYISKNDYNFRLTFDENIYAVKSDILFPELSDGCKLLPGYTVLEIKFLKYIPVWFKQIIQNYHLKRVSVSKYRLGIKRIFIKSSIS